MAPVLKVRVVVCTFPVAPEVVIPFTEAIPKVAVFALATVKAPAPDTIAPAAMLVVPFTVKVLLVITFTLLVFKILHTLPKATVVLPKEFVPPLIFISPVPPLMNETVEVVAEAS